MVSHLSEELPFVNSAIKLSKSFVALVVADPSKLVSAYWWMGLPSLPGLLGIEDTKTVRVIHIVILELVKLSRAQIVDDHGPTRRHEVRPDVVCTTRYLPVKSVFPSRKTCADTVSMDMRPRSTYL